MKLFTISFKEEMFILQRQPRQPKQRIKAVNFMLVYLPFGARGKMMSWKLFAVMPSQVILMS